MAVTDPWDSARHRLRLVAAMMLLIAALAAALLIHHRFVAPSGKSGLRDRPGGVGEGLGGPLPKSFEPMAELFSEAAAVSTRGDPGDLPPPAGAQLIAADTGKIDSQIVDRAQYVSDASMDDIGSYYERLMIERGFHRAGTTSRPDGSLTVVYVSPEAKTILSLRKPRPDNTIESIVVMFFRPIDRAE